MKVVKIKFIETHRNWRINEYNHAPGCGQGDYTLCGEDHAGDDDREISYVEGKITCPNCIRIIKYCKSIKASDISDSC